MRKVRNTRAKGSKFEHLTRRHLEAMGWFVVRQASSAFPDLIAVKKTYKGRKIIFVECKYNGYLSLGEKGKLLKLCNKTNCSPMLSYCLRGKPQLLPL